MLAKTLTITALSAALLAGAVVASSYDRDDYYQRRGPMPFELLDLNNDGKVTAEEHAQVRTERQKVRAEQGYPMRRAGAAPRFEDIDSDASGSIDRDELSTWQTRRMQQRQAGRPGPWNK